MSEVTNIVTMHGNPLTLAGRQVQTGEVLPDAQLIDNNMKPVKLSAYRGKVVVLSVVPSLDTPVCDMQTRRFNTEATGLGDDVVILTVSMDLPFAQKRWCGAAGVRACASLRWRCWPAPGRRCAPGCSACRDCWRWRPRC